jgi:phage portal protein BeeE
VVDTLTKWIEVKPTASIIAAMVVEFIREIMYWFGVPNNFITDNGTQVNAREFRTFVQMWALRSIMPQSQTCRSTVKPSDPTV